MEDVKAMLEALSNIREGALLLNSSPSSERAGGKGPKNATVFQKITQQPS
jgi:hypothetical protein